MTLSVCLSGECGDYSDTARMAAAFTTQIALEGEAEATGVRPPSYTDRILSFSLEDKKDFLRQVAAWGRASRQLDSELRAHACLC